MNDFFVLSAECAVSALERSRQRGLREREKLPLPVAGKRGGVVSVCSSHRYSRGCLQQLLRIKHRPVGQAIWMRMLCLGMAKTNTQGCCFMKMCNVIITKCMGCVYAPRKRRLHMHNSCYWTRCSVHTQTQTSRLTEETREIAGERERDWRLDMDMNLEWLCCGLARKIIISQVIIGFAIQMRTHTHIDTHTRSHWHTHTHGDREANTELNSKSSQVRVASRRELHKFLWKAQSTNDDNNETLSERQTGGQTDWQTSTGPASYGGELGQ